MGVGAAAIVVSGGLYLKTRSDAQALKKDITAYGQTAVRTTAAADDLKERRSALGKQDTLTVAVGGVGVAALATGLVLYLTGGDRESRSARTHVDAGGLTTSAVDVGFWFGGSCGGAVVQF